MRPSSSSRTPLLTRLVRGLAFVSIVIPALIIVALIGTGLVAYAARPLLRNEEVGNESPDKKPNNLKMARVSVTTAASVALTTLTGASEAFIRNPQDGAICLNWAFSGATCTATCSGATHIRLRQDESISLPIPKGTASGATTSSYTTGFGTICAIANANATNSENVEVVERDQ